MLNKSLTQLPDFEIIAELHNENYDIVHIFRLKDFDSVYGYIEINKTDIYDQGCDISLNYESDYTYSEIQMYMTSKAKEGFIPFIY